MVLSGFSFSATLSKDGGLLPVEGPAVLAKLKRWGGRAVTVTIEPFRDLRSLQQNKRYWVRIVPVCGEILGRTRDVPLSKEQVHFVLASAFLGTVDTPLGSTPMRTRVISTEEFSEYCDRIEHYFVREYGAVFPEVGELEAASS